MRDRALHVPAIPLNTTYHVGRLNGRREATSYEGRHFSVSFCPERWRFILDPTSPMFDPPTWRICRSDGSIRLFLDVDAVTAACRRRIDAWGVVNGYLRRAVIWEVRFTDEGDPVREAYLDEHQARREADDDGEISRVRGVVATKKLEQRINYRGAVHWLASDHNMLVWAEEQGFEGAWWRAPDPSRPSRSAPKGCIFLNRFSEWEREEILDDGMAGPPDSHLVSIPMPRSIRHVPDPKSE